MELEAAGGPATIYFGFLIYFGVIYRVFRIFPVKTELRSMARFTPPGGGGSDSTHRSFGARLRTARNKSVINPT